MTAKTAITDEFRSQEVTVREVVYRFRELTANEYEEIVKVASGEDDQADLATVLKMMTTKALVEPALTAKELGEKPYPVYQKLLQTVNKMHFSAEDGSPNA